MAETIKTYVSVATCTDQDGYDIPIAASMNAERLRAYMAEWWALHSDDEYWRGGWSISSGQVPLIEETPQ